MAIAARHDVHEGKRVGVFVDFVRRHLAAQDFREDIGRRRKRKSTWGLAGMTREQRLPNATKWPPATFDMWMEAGRLFAMVPSRNGPCSSRYSPTCARLRAALAVEIVGDGIPEAGMGDVMRRMHGHRHIAARQLVFALRSCLDDFQLPARSRSRSPGGSRPRNADSDGPRCSPSCGHRAHPSR